jgi:hypothetical protein
MKEPFHLRGEPGTKTTYAQIHARHGLVAPFQAMHTPHKTDPETHDNHPEHYDWIDLPVTLDKTRLNSRPPEKILRKQLGQARYTRINHLTRTTHT